MAKNLDQLKEERLALVLAVSDRYLSPQKDVPPLRALPYPLNLIIETPAPIELTEPVIEPEAGSRSATAPRKNLHREQRLKKLQNNH